MKTLKNVVLSLMLIMMLVMTGCTRVNPGYTGIKVVYGGGDRGVQDFPVVTGWVGYIPFFSTVFEYPTFVQTAVWTKSPNEGSKNNEELSFNSREGMVITADVSLSYELIAAKVPNFYVKFRSDDLGNFTHGFLRNIARDAFNEIASTYPLEDLYGDKKEVFLKKVRDSVNSQVNSYGVNIVQFGFVGAPRLPELVLAALNAKITANQKSIQSENELRQAKAEAQKIIATAEGAAKANEVLSRSLTPTLIEWEKLQIAKQTVWKWDGKRPYYEGQGAGLMFAK